MMSEPELDEPELIRALFHKLQKAPSKSFARTMRGVSNLHGVYVIYSADGEVLYVGRTHRGDSFRRHSSFAFGGLRRRLSKHRATYRRKHCCFQFLIVEDPRQRALLEAYATGCLCPLDIRVSDIADPYIVPVDPNDEPALFVAREYVKERIRIICKSPEARLIDP